MTTSRAVLITGCSTGIGRAAAIRLARAGWPVYATAREVGALAGLDGCSTRALDVTDESSMRAVVDEITRAHGAVGVLINNAGYSQSGAVESIPMALVRRQFETNLFGAARLAQLVLPGMRAQRWGKIVNISSVGGKVVFPGGGIYHATKHALEAMTDALRFEVRGFGVDAIIIEPGVIRTRFAGAVADAVAHIDPEGPYAAFNAQVVASTHRAYHGVVSRFMPGPDAVAKTIARAISDEHPRARYRVGTNARMLLTMRKLMPDRAWDMFVRAAFKRPEG